MEDICNATVDAGFSFVRSSAIKGKVTRLLTTAGVEMLWNYSPEPLGTHCCELDANDNVIFDARSYEGKYRAFKHVFYSPTTKNIDVGKLNILNTIPNTDLTNKNYKDAELDKAVEWINTLDITKNTLVTDYTFKEDDQVDLYLVNKDGKVFIMNYLSKDNKLTATIFNLELPANEYALFIKVNDILYDTKSLMVFSR
jgi:hypothetical protein